jgi:hypothetical protein
MQVRIGDSSKCIENRLFSRSLILAYTTLALVLRLDLTKI